MTPHLPIGRNICRTAVLPVLCPWLDLVAGHPLAQEHGPRRPDPVATLGADPDSADGPRAVKSKTIDDIPIWKRIAIGTHKDVNTVRAALDAVSLSRSSRNSCTPRAFASSGRMPCS